MPWFKVDDSLSDHPDVLALLERRNGFAALGLWTVSGAWSSRQLTEGLISSVALKRLGGTRSQALALVDAGLWEAVDGGYQFRNWLKWQPSKRSVQDKRDAARERMQRHRSREQAGEPTRAVQPPRPDPTRPDPEPQSPLAPSVPCAADVAAEVYAEVTGSTELGLPGSRTHKQDQALITMGRWSGGDRAKLKAELIRLRDGDPWLAKQPAHIIADRIGTGDASPHGGKSFAQRVKEQVICEH